MQIKKFTLPRAINCLLGSITGLALLSGMLMSAYFIVIFTMDSSVPTGMKVMAIIGIGGITSVAILCLIDTFLFLFKAIFKSKKEDIFKPDQSNDFIWQQMKTRE